MPRNTANITEKELQHLAEIGKIRSYKVISRARQHVQQGADKPHKKSKYNSTKVVVDGIEFDSEKEAKRYKDLLFLQKKGIIGLLELQKEYELNAGGTHSLKYVADFVYVEMSTGQQVVEDCKGFRTKEYKKKRRLMKKVHGIEVFET